MGKLSKIFYSKSPVREENKFINDVLTLVSGTTFSQILLILATPFLTRIYGPEDFGFFALFVSITSIMGIIACLRYELTIMIPRSDDEAASLFNLSLIVSLLVGIFSVPFFWFGKQTLTDLLKAPLLSNYLYLVPLFVFVSGVFLTLNYWNSRTKRFHSISVAKISSSIVTTGSQIGMGSFGYATGGSLIYSNLIGQVVSIIFLFIEIWKNDNSLIKRNFSLNKMVSGVKKYRNFPLVDTWAALLNTVSWQLPTFLLAAFFSPAVVGYYSLGFRLLQLPMSFIGSSISQVFFQRASEAKSNGTLTYLVERIFRFLVVFGLFPFFVITFIGDDLFYVIFGSKWIESGVYVQILGIWSFVWFISSPLSVLWIILEKQKFGFKITLINLVTRFMSLFIGGLVNNVYIGLLLFSVSGFFVYVYLCVKLMIDAGVKVSTIWSIVTSNITLFSPFLILLIILKILSHNSFIIVFISFLMIGIYYIHIFKTDSQLSFLLKQIGLKYVN